MIAMQAYTPWIVAVALALVVAVVLRQIMHRRHLKRLATERARHHRAEQASATQLQGARQQIAALQRELAAARHLNRGAGAVVAPSPVDAPAAARERLNRLLDEASPPELPAHGFADTQPAERDTRSTGANVLLQRSTPGK
jgi:heme exporter protein D